jgi:maltose/moltooligosaccharide transporter
MEKPRQGFWGLWNISFGFFGIQVAFGLQNANISRIFQTLGSDVDSLAFLWMAGPVTGLIVQPLIGHFSDRTWSRFGRRRPYFLAGALLGAAGLLGMPFAPILLVGALWLWIIDASLNVAMEPFRAFVGDMLSAKQHASGYAFQTAFIGAGAVLGSLAPKLIAMAGVSNVAAAGIVPPSVRLAFILGAAAMVAAVVWTVATTREYAPDEMRAFADEKTEGPRAPSAPLVVPAQGYWWLGGGILLLAAVWTSGSDKQLYVLGGALALYGIAQIGVRAWSAAGRKPVAISHILSDLAQMPKVMRQLALAQFFTWIALFIMWIYTTPIVTQYIFHSTDPSSKAYNEGGDWVGVLFSIYNGVAAVAAFLLPVLAKRLGAARTHAICLLLGAISLGSILFIRNANLMILPMVGIGITWSSILCLPYVILARSLPSGKLGIYMGIFNFFIVIPQLLTSAIMGVVLSHFFPGKPVWAMLVGALAMILASLAMLRVKDSVTM